MKQNIREIVVRFDGKNVEVIDNTPLEPPGFDLMCLLDGIKKHYVCKALAKSEYRSTYAAQLLGFSSYQVLDYCKKKLGVTHVSIAKKKI